MTDKQNPNLFFDCVVQQIKNLKRLLFNFYAVTLEDIDLVTQIGEYET